jgi:uncharacterized PurR-regulated membrane protein YhhQ (DUF165 family)
MKIKFLILLYFISIISANLLIQFFGVYALLASSFILIPFDFVIRCILHEKWKGKQLIIRLFLLTFLACITTYVINQKSEDIALASILGFTSAQVIAGIFYQINKSRSWFMKVNISDLLAIIFDSIVFQLTAFSHINPLVIFFQINIKFAGGLLWFFILFKFFKIQNSLINERNI